MTDDPPALPPPPPALLAPEHDGRPQAPPLPTKQGEIGYLPPPPGTPSPVAGPSNTTTTERDTPVPSSPRPTAPPITTAPTALPTPSPTTSSRATPDPKRAVRTWKGFHIRTLLITLAILLLLAGTIAGWALAAVHLQAPSSSSLSTASLSPAPTSEQQSTNSTQSTGSVVPSSGGAALGNSTTSSSGSSAQSMLTSGLVFVHVAFAVATLLQLVLLDRLLLRLLRQRRAFLRPSSPSSSSSSGPSAGVLGAEDEAAGGSFLARLAPWARPPLPSYLNAVMGGTRGTGDVDDLEIARPPPPEYGNYRGSVLLLANVLSRRSTRSSLRGEGEGGRGDVELGRVAGPDAEGLGEEGRADAERARVLEETLERLTRPLAAAGRR